MSQWVCGRCKSINRDRAVSCYSCGGARGAVQLGAAPSVPSFDAAPAAPIMGAGASASLDAGMAAGDAVPLAGDARSPAGFAPSGGFAPSAALATPEAGALDMAGAIGATAVAEAEPAGLGNVLGGFLGGLIAAVLATAIWYGVVVATQFQVGLVAIAVGWLVGQGVAFGAGRRGSIVLIPISVALTFVALAVSEYLIVAHFVGQELALEGVEIELLQPPGFMVEVVAASLQSDPLTLVFWGIALIQAFLIPMRLVTRTN